MDQSPVSEVLESKKECFKELQVYDSRILNAKTNGEVQGIDGTAARNYLGERLTQMGLILTSGSYIMSMSPPGARHKM